MPASHHPRTATIDQLQPGDLASEVERILDHAPIFDIHTHLYPPSFQKLFSAGIDDLVTYHYLIAEVFRSSDISIPAFWAMSQGPTGRSDLGHLVCPEYALVGSLPWSAVRIDSLRLGSVRQEFTGS